jgi:hypothetical protein
MVSVSRHRLPLLLLGVIVTPWMGVLGVIVTPSLLMRRHNFRYHVLIFILLVVVLVILLLVAKDRRNYRRQ